MPLTIGETVVIPALGAGVVTGAKLFTISEISYDVYVITMLKDGSLYTIPTTNVENKGVRPVMSKEKAEKLYTFFREKPQKLEKQTWNRRHRAYMEKLQSGELEEIAEIVKNFAYWRTEKVLSFGERRLFQRTMELIVQEVALAKEISDEEALAEIETIFASYGQKKRISEKSVAI